MVVVGDSERRSPGEAHGPAWAAGDVAGLRPENARVYAWPAMPLAGVMSTLWIRYLRGWALVGALSIILSMTVVACAGTAGTRAMDTPSEPPGEPATDPSALPPDGDLDPAFCEAFTRDEPSRRAVGCRLFTQQRDGIRAVHVYTGSGGEFPEGFSAVLFDGRWHVLQSFVELVSPRHALAVVLELGDLDAPPGESEMILVARSLRSGERWELAACASPSLAPDEASLACRGPRGQLYRSALPAGGRTLVGDAYEGDEYPAWYPHWGVYQPPATFMPDGTVRYQIPFDGGGEYNEPRPEVRTVRWPVSAP